MNDERTFWFGLRQVMYIEFDENAFTWAHLGRAHDRQVITLLYSCEAPRTSRIVQCDAAFGDIGDSVFELNEHVWAVVDAQTISGAQVLVDPHAHRANVTAGPGLCAKQCDEIERNEQRVAHHCPP